MKDDVCFRFRFDVNAFTRKLGQKRRAGVDMRDLTAIMWAECLPRFW